MSDLAGKTIFEGSPTVTVAKQPSGTEPQWTLWFQANCSNKASFFLYATRGPVRETVFEGSLVVRKAKQPAGLHASVDATICCCLFPCV